jgi:hypothetical protein
MNKKMAKLGAKTNLKKEEVRNLTKIGIFGLLAITFSVFTFGWIDSSAAEVKPRPEKDKSKTLSKRCGLKPEKGPCKAIFDKYYFDAGTNTCKSFFYGGCDGVVPFETQEECDKACVGRKTTKPSNGVSKYAAVSIRDFENAK